MTYLRCIMNRAIHVATSPLAKDKALAHIANAGPINDRQRKAMFAKGGGGGGPKGGTSIVGWAGQQKGAIPTKTGSGGVGMGGTSTDQAMRAARSNPWGAGNRSTDPTGGVAPGAPQFIGGVDQSGIGPGRRLTAAEEARLRAPTSQPSENMEQMPVALPGKGNIAPMPVLVPGKSRMEQMPVAIPEKTKIVDGQAKLDMAKARKELTPPAGLSKIEQAMWKDQAYGRSGTRTDAGYIDSNGKWTPDAGRPAPDNRLTLPGGPSQGRDTNYTGGSKGFDETGGRGIVTTGQEKIIPGRPNAPITIPKQTPRPIVAVGSNPGIVGGRVGVPAPLPTQTQPARGIPAKETNPMQGVTGVALAGQLSRQPSQTWQEQTQFGGMPNLTKWKAQTNTARKFDAESLKKINAVAATQRAILADKRTPQQKRADFLASIQR